MMTQSPAFADMLRRCAAPTPHPVRLHGLCVRPWSSMWILFYNQIKSLFSHTLPHQTIHIFSLFKNGTKSDLFIRFTEYHRTMDHTGSVCFRFGVIVRGSLRPRPHQRAPSSSDRNPPPADLFGSGPLWVPSFRFRDRSPQAGHHADGGPLRGGCGGQAPTTFVPLDFGDHFS